jgi:tripartite-type tricarboxylate transporter receptor subunit TctC
MRRRIALLLPMTLPRLARAQGPEAGPRAGGGPIRLIVPFAPGGGADAAAHILAPPLATALGRAILVENRPGGRGIPGAETLARAVPDGQTLGLSGTPQHGMAGLVDRPPYDCLHDFAHIALIAETPTVLLVPATSRLMTMETYLRAGRSWAGGLTYGSPAVGSLPHLQGDMLARATGALLVHVAYRGTAAALQDLVNGQVDSVFAPLASAAPVITAGQARALAVSAAAPEEMLPGVPSFAALGFPQLTASNWVGLSGPRGLSPALVTRLNAEVNRIIATPEVAGRLRAVGYTPPDRPLDAAGYRQLIADFAEHWRPAVAMAGMAP